MSEVFISYAREDEATARALARALEAAGLAVWWDRESIPTGHRFDDAIETALGAAKAAVVLWSSHSIRSSWVRDEAQLAVERGILQPILIDDVRPPMGFRGLEYVDLRHWDGNSEDPLLDRFVAQVSALVPRRQQGPRPGLWTTWNRSPTRKGARGHGAARVQRALRSVGFLVEEDGIFGRNTHAAVQWFQASRALASDGVVGDLTWNALLLDGWYRGAALPVLALGSRGQSVVELQGQLASLGHENGLDGSFGVLIQQAVRAVQRDHGLEDDGIVGPDTRLAIQHADRAPSTTRSRG